MFSLLSACNVFMVWEIGSVIAVVVVVTWRNHTGSDGDAGGVLELDTGSDITREKKNE